MEKAFDTFCMCKLAVFNVNMRSGEAIKFFRGIYNFGASQISQANKVTREFDEIYRFITFNYFSIIWDVSFAEILIV